MDEDAVVLLSKGNTSKIHAVRDSKNTYDYTGCFYVCIECIDDLEVKDGQTIV